MDCREIDRMLDDLMDGVLVDEERRALEDHCANCADCAAKLRATQSMMRLFDDMAPEVSVPLEIQANWHAAIKAESKKVNRKRFLRWGGGIAAALVVGLGITLTLAHPAARLSAMPMSEASVEKSLAIVETDGQLMESMDSAVSRAMPMHELALPVNDLSETCDYLKDLVSEYEGVVDIQDFEENGKACANLFIDLPAENTKEFIDAATRLADPGALNDAIESGTEEDGRISLLLVLKEA